MHQNEQTTSQRRFEKSTGIMMRIPTNAFRTVGELRHKCASVRLSALQSTFMVKPRSCANRFHVQTAFMADFDEPLTYQQF
jgi:hypothetical protein